MTRLVLLVISVAAGAVLAFGTAFAVTSVLNSSNQNPVNQQLNNYGTR